MLFCFITFIIANCISTLSLGCVYSKSCSLGSCIVTVDADTLKRQNDDFLKISNSNNLVRLEDRTYSPLSFSGKGFKILRKNLSFGKNVLAQSMMSEPNTIYHIQYDYDLCGKKIVLPEGCILKFEGGSLSNGILCGNNTIVSSLPYHILKDVSIVGSFNVEESYAEWLGAKGDGKYNDTEYLQKSLDYFSTVKLCPNKNYYITNSLTFAFRRSLVGSNSTTISADGDFTLFKVGYNTFISGLNISLNAPQTVVSITSQQIAKSYFDYDKSADAWKYRQDADIKISNLRIFSRNHDKVNDEVSCFESLANGIGTGFWQVNVENIYIYGRYKYGIYISNAKVNNYQSETWQTDQVWKNIKIHQAENAVYIGNNGDLSGKLGWKVGRILFDNVSMQYVNDVTKHFAVLDECEYVTFESCTAWDWPQASEEYIINPNKAKGVAILNAPLHSQGANVSLTEVPHSPNSVPFITSAVDSPVKSAYDIGFFKPDLTKRCTNEFIRSLPSGLYLIPSDVRYNTFFGINQEADANMGFGPNLLSLEHARNGMVLLTFYCTYFKGIQSLGYLVVPGNEEGELKDVIFCNPKIFVYDSIQQFKAQSKNKKYFWGFVRHNNGSYKLAFKINKNEIVDALGKPFEMKVLHIGTTEQRPIDVEAGFYFFDTTLNKPIWKMSDDGTDWVDAMGNSI